MNKNEKRNPIRIILLLLIYANLHTIFAQTDTYTYKIVTYSGTPPADALGIYVQYGTYSSKPSYVKVNGSGSNNNVSYTYYSLGYWTVYNSIQDVDWWYAWTNSPGPSTFPTGTTWNSNNPVIGSSGITTSQFTKVTPTFTSGSGFTPGTPTLPATNHPIGRFQLTGSTNAGVVLQALTVSLTGTRTNVSNIKLWSSSSSTFNSGTATNLSTVGTDNTSITFSGFNSLVDNSSGTYYFITVNLAAGATGSVTATIPSQSSFTFAGANSPGSFSNAALSSGAAPLPVELTSFTAVSLGNAVNLNWVTATEVNNYGFNVETLHATSLQGTSASLSASWETLGFVQGHGNSNSPKSYSFEDKNPSAGKVQYRLKQIDFDGAFEYSPVVDLTVDAPVATELRQNFPNPFNPETVISYKVQAASYITLKVFDMLGREVTTLVNELKQPGSYQVNFNTSHVERSRNMPSGIYYYKLQAGNFVSVKKMLLIK